MNVVCSSENLVIHSKYHFFFFVKNLQNRKIYHANDQSINGTEVLTETSISRRKDSYCTND